MEEDGEEGNEQLESSKFVQDWLQTQENNTVTPDVSIYLSLCLSVCLSVYPCSQVNDNINNLSI